MLSDQLRRRKTGLFTKRTFYFRLSTKPSCCEGAAKTIRKWRNLVDAEETQFLFLMKKKVRRYEINIKTLQKMIE